MGAEPICGYGRHARPYIPGTMIRFRNVAIVAVLAAVVYALAPAARKARFLDKVREFGRALVISLVLYWLLIIGRAWFAG